MNKLISLKHRLFGYLFSALGLLVFYSAIWLFFLDTTFAPFFLSLFGPAVMFALALCTTVKAAFLSECGITLLRPNNGRLEFLKFLTSLWLCSSILLFCFLGAFFFNHPGAFTSLPPVKLIAQAFGIATDLCTPFALRNWINEQVIEKPAYNKTRT